MSKELKLVHEVLATVVAALPIDVADKGRLNARLSELNKACSGEKKTPATPKPKVTRPKAAGTAIK